jgi:hypothetical protein
MSIDNKTIELPQQQPMSFTERLFEADKVWQQIFKVSLDKRRAILNSWAAEYFEPMEKTQLSTCHTMNLIDRAVEIIVPYLVMNNPYMMVEATDPKHRPFAYTTELAVNQWIQKFKFAMNTIYPAVRNSLFSIGIVRSGIMKSHQVEIMGCLHDVGQPYADVIDEPDFTMDPAAKTFESAAFMGNYYYMPTDVARDFFPKKFADYITSSVKLYSHGTCGDDRLQSIPDFDENPKFLKPMTRFVDHWLPDEGVIITNLADGATKRILREVEWKGHEGGPYDILAYKFMPDTAIPIPPAWSWMDLDAIFNTVINKIKLQALGQKTVIAYEGEAATDADKIAVAGDRQTVRVEHIDSIKPITFPGVDPDSYKFLNYFQSQWSQQGKNLNVAGGLESDAATLGQEQMLMANANRGLDHMENRVYEFVQSIMEKIIVHMWDDPTYTATVVKSVKGVGQIAVDWNKSTREGDVLDYKYTVKPLSMQRPTAESLFQKIIQLITQWVLPTGQMAAAQGAQTDVPTVTKKLAKLMGIDDFDDIYQTAQSQNVEMGGYQPNPEKPQNKAVMDGRTGMNPEASRQQNLLQKSARPTMTPKNM